MFPMRWKEEQAGVDRAPKAEPPLVEMVHRAIFFREDALMKDNPDARIDIELQDSEPRAILWLVAPGGKVLSKEFVETAFSADKEGRDEEYIDAARRYGSIAVHYPGMLMAKEHVIRRLADLWVKIGDRNVQEKAIIKGFLYDSGGRPMLEV